jgi:hypothetical protein
MNNYNFLCKALGSEGNYCIFAANKETEQKVQRFYDSIEQLVDDAYELDQLDYDVYFALSTFGDEQSRKVSNVRYLKSFFLDLDCGPSKEFTTQEDAIKQLRQFCKTNNLPKPALVNSGRGVHVYWFLTEQVCYDDWLPVAERLKRLCAESDFPADPAVTSDAARVLRVPDTHNYKTNPPSKVELFRISDNVEAVDFDAFSELLGNDPIPVPKKYEPLAPSQTMLNLMGNQEHVFKDIMMKTAKGEGCAQLKHIMVNQAELPEPLWRAGLSIAKFCTDYAKAMVKLSDKHPEFSIRETQKKLDLIKGPYTCAKFDEFNPDVCTDCPNWGKIKSPIVLGTHVVEAEVNEEGEYVEAPAIDLPNAPILTYPIPKYPSPYFRGANGGVYLRSSSADGETDERCVYHNDFYIVKRITDPEEGEMVVARLHLPKDGVRELTLPLTTVTSREEFRKAMSKVGVAALKMDELMSYTTSWINELQATSVAEEAHTQFGWADDNMEEFILGNQRITADSVEFNPPTSKTVGLFPYFEPKGTLEEWKEAVSFWDDPKFVIQQFGMCAGFGSILIPFSNVHCSTLHLHSSDSGLGKTLIMHGALGIWGKPESLIMYKKDTANSKYNRGEAYKNLPLCIDEVTKMKSHEISDLLYQLTDGKQRSRMYSGSNSERHRGKEWRMLAMTTANESLIQKISGKEMPEAEAQRVLECFVHRLFPKEGPHKAVVDAFENKIKNIYGHAGVPFVQYVIKNKESVRKLFKEVQLRVDTKAKLSSENRFWSAGIAAILTGAMIAKKLGLINFDTKYMFNWVISDLVPQNKHSVNSMQRSVSDVLNDFFTENISYILQIKSTLDNRGKQDNGLDQLVIPEQIARGKLIARYETDTKLFYVKPKALKTWCADLQINYANLVKQVMESCEGKKAKVRLTKGTHLQLPAADVLCMKFDHDSETEGSEDV